MSAICGGNIPFHTTSLPFWSHLVSAVAFAGDNSCFVSMVFNHSGISFVDHSVALPSSLTLYNLIINLAHFPVISPVSARSWWYLAILLTMRCRRISFGTHPHRKIMWLLVSFSRPHLHIPSPMFMWLCSRSFVKYLSHSSFILSARLVGLRMRAFH